MSISLLAGKVCRWLVHITTINLSISVGLTLYASHSYANGTADAASQHSSRVIPDDLFGVDFFDRDNGLISGYYGTVVKTTDAGRSWQVVDTGSRQLLRRVDMLTADIAWAVGHKGDILNTEDGGSSWQIINSHSEHYLRDVDFADRQTGWIVGHEATILFTDDGGKHWQRQTISGYQGRDLPRLNGVVAIDRATAVAVGEFGVIAKTSDGGKHWRLIEHSAKTTLTAVDRVNDYIVAVGLDGYACRIGRLYDERAITVNTGTDNHLLDISFNRQGSGYAVGRAVILEYRDGGFIHSEVSDDLDLAYKWYGGVYASDNSGVWAVGQRGEVIRLPAGADIAEDMTDSRFSASYRLGLGPVKSPAIRENNYAR